MIHSSGIGDPETQTLMSERHSNKRREEPQGDGSRPITNHDTDWPLCSGSGEGVLATDVVRWQRGATRPTQMRRENAESSRGRSLRNAQ